MNSVPALGGNPYFNNGGVRGRRADAFTEGAQDVVEEFGLLVAGQRQVFLAHQLPRFIEAARNADRRDLAKRWRARANARFGEFVVPL